MNYRYPKSVRLLTRKDFQSISGAHSSANECPFLLSIRKNSLRLTRLGISVSRRFGKAHNRNRFKRIVREGFRLVLPNLPQGFDLHVRPYRPGSIPTCIEVQTVLVQSLKSKATA